MKTRLLSTLFCFIFITDTLAQAPVKTTIKGNVADSVKKQPMAFVTVLLKDAQNNQPIRSVLSKDNGSFEISAPVGKALQIVFAFIGYKSKTVSVPAIDKPGQEIDLGKIILGESSGQLKEVSIVEAKPIMKQEVDRISYDVQADPESKSTSALDMIRKVPLLTVDANDNIKLKGSGNYKILINGKESSLMAKNPSDVLKSMPGTNIEKIEVITTPPAKYDAEGLAGIINIITKKNADQGYNGNVNGRYNSVYGPGINLNATVKQGKFGLSGFVGTSSNGTQNTTSGSGQTFLNTQSLLSQNSVNNYYGHNNYAEAELSFEIDTLNLLTGSLEYYSGTNNNSSDQLSTQFLNAGTISQQYRLNNSDANTYLGIDAGINYQIGFKKSKDQLLTLSYKYSYSPDKDYYDNLFTDTLKFNNNNYRQYNKAGNKTQTMQIDYVQPLTKKLNIEAGGKLIIRNNFSDFETSVYDNPSKQYLIDPKQTNNFDYRQNVYSAYNSYQLKLTKWTAKAGLRIEHTGIDANFVSAGTAVSQGYNNLIPSISIQRLFKSSSINLGFTQRIQRPRIWQLNPFVNSSNPLFINTGNPDLRPELNNTFELTYSNFAKASINVGLSYAFSNNAIQNVTYTTTRTNADNKPYTVTTTTYQNLGSNNGLGFNVNTNLTLAKKLTVSVNGQLRQIWLKGYYSGQFYQNEGLTGSAYLNAGYKFDSGYRMGFNAGYYTGDVMLQGQSSRYIYNSYVFSKEFLAKKATISLVANNPYSKFTTNRSSTITPDFNQSSFNQNIYRTFAVRFSYKFGKLNSEIKKNQRGISNDDTKGGK